jgi:hypothetical protein
MLRTAFFFKNLKNNYGKDYFLILDCDSINGMGDLKLSFLKNYKKGTLETFFTK